MGRVRITRPFVLLALAVLLSPPAEASRTSVWERNPPASLTATRADEAGLLASLAPIDVADVDATGLPHFDLGDIALVERELEHEERFGLGPLDLLGPTPLRGPPPSYPETRIGGFELLPPFRVGASASLSLWGRQACGFSCREVVSDSRYDPWGLSFWSSIQGYVAGITEEADPTGLLPEVEAIDAGYHTGSRDAEDFDASKTAGKWTLRGLTALKAGAQKAGKFGIKAITSALKSEAKEAATSFGAGVAGDLTEDALVGLGVDEEEARVAGRLARAGAARGLSSPRLGIRRSGSPAPNDGHAKKHGSDAHNNKVDQVAAAMRRGGWRDVRKNQRQVDVNRDTAGSNRPDTSGINPVTGQRVNVEYDTNPRQSAKHQREVVANDPGAVNVFVIIDPVTGNPISAHVYKPKP